MPGASVACDLDVFEDAEGVLLLLARAHRQDRAGPVSVTGILSQGRIGTPRHPMKVPPRTSTVWG
jgi:hypothetical protein